MKNDKTRLREAIRSILREIDAAPNVSTQDSLENLRRYVADSIDLSGYGEYESVPKSRRLQAVVDIFREEKGWDIENQGQRRAFIDYLRGMPSILGIATYYDEIRNLLYALGYDEVKSMEDEDLDRLYYNELYRVFFG